MNVPLIDPNTGRIDVVNLTGKVQAIRADAIERRQEILRRFPAWRPDSDVRCTSLAKLANVMGSLQLGCMFWFQQLLSDNWWQERACSSEADQRAMRNEFQAFLKVA